jgi:hypothetical protein
MDCGVYGGGGEEEGFVRNFVGGGETLPSDEISIV